MLKFTSTNYQFSYNLQFTITNEKQNAPHFPTLKIESCELKIATQKGVA